MAACLAWRALSSRTFLLAASFRRCRSRRSAPPGRCRWPCGSHSHAGLTGKMGSPTPCCSTAPSPSPNLSFLCPRKDEPPHRRPGSFEQGDGSALQSRGRETRKLPGPLSWGGPGTWALLTERLRAGREPGPRQGVDTGRCSFDHMVPETLPCMLGPLGSRLPPSCGSHPHTDLSLGCQQALQAGCSSSAPLCLVPVPTLDGDGGLVHLVDKPAQRADSARAPANQLGPPKAQPGREASSCTHGPCSGGRCPP